MRHSPTPKCIYHPAIKMQRVAGTTLRMFGKARKNPHQYFRCSVAGCPFVVTIEKPEPPPKDPFRRYPKTVKRIPWPNGL
jgi:hypothetical protein